MQSLKGCIPSLENIIKSESTHELLDKTMVTKLLDEIQSLDHDLHSDGQNRTRDYKMSDLKQAMRDLNDPLMPSRAHALIQIKRLIMSRDEEVKQNKHQLIVLLKTSLADPESYIYLSAINTLSALAILFTDDTLPILVHEYLNENRSIQERINTGQVLVNVSKSLNEFSSKYAKILIPVYYDMLAADTDPVLKCSSLSCLGEICSAMKHSLRPYINQMIQSLESLLTDSSSPIEVKRAGMLFLSLLLSGLDGKSVEAIADQIMNIYRLVKDIYDRNLDELMQLHSQICLQHFQRIVQDLTTPDNGLTRSQQLIQIL